MSFLMSRLCAFPHPRVHSTQGSFFLYFLPKITRTRVYSRRKNSSMSSTFLEAASRRATDTIATPARLPLQPGIRAVISGLVARADLNGAECTLLSFAPANGRWAVRTTVSGEGVRVRPMNLHMCPSLLERSLPEALVREILAHCDVPTLRVVSETCSSLRLLSCSVLSSSAYRRKLDFTTLARWRASRSVYGFMAFDSFQRHRPFPHMPGRLSCRAARVVHSGCMGMAHLWDAEQGKMLAGFQPPYLAVGRLGSVGTSIDEVALSSNGLLAASVRARASPLGESTVPHVVVYDARGADAEARRGPGHVVGGPNVRGREPLCMMSSPWDVAGLGWTSCTRFIALSRTTSIAEPSAELGSRLAWYELLPDGSSWAHDEARVLEEVAHPCDSVNAMVITPPCLLEALATHENRGMAAVADTCADLHIWSSCAGGGHTKIASFASGHTTKPKGAWTTTISAIVFSHSGRILASAGAHDFSIRVHRISEDGKTATLYGAVCYRDAIATRPWFTGWQQDMAADNNIDEPEDAFESLWPLDDLTDFRSRYEVDGAVEQLEEGAKHVLESMSMSGERMLVSGHRKGCVCVWELDAAAPDGDPDGAHCTASLLATMPPPDAHTPPSTSPSRSVSELAPLTASDEMIRGVAIVGTHGIGAAGPALVYANRAGALTKLCTIDSKELSLLTEKEWQKYEKEQPDPGDLYRGAPWDTDEKHLHQ